MKKGIFSLLLWGCVSACIMAEVAPATTEKKVEPAITTCPMAEVAKPAACPMNKEVATPAACPMNKEVATPAACPMTEVTKPAAASSAPVVIIGADGQWDFFTLGFWFDVPYSTSYSNVCGIKIGAPFCSGKGTVRGIETAVFCGATDNIEGLQACILVSKSEKVNGMQFSIVNYATMLSGLQLGVVNVAQKKSFQLGIVNYIEDAPIPFLPIFNYKF